MSERTHPRAVGAFVLGAVALVLAAVVGLSSGDWFAKKEHFSIFFPGSVRGLNPGVPVTFRGVKVGEVKDVTAFLTEKDPLIQIEVVIELRREVVRPVKEGPRPFESLRGEALARALIERGIRARMTSQSLLTGQKYIELDFLPEEPARFAGIARRYPELPTTPTAMEKLGQKGEQFFAKLAELPLDQMLEDVRKALQSLRTLLESEDLRRAISGARRATEALEPTLTDARGALADARRLVDTLDTEVKGTTAEARETAKKARETLERAERALSSIQTAAEGADEARVKAGETLAELRQTLSALRNLVDYIQTHPEAVVLGKSKTEEKK